MILLTGERVLPGDVVWIRWADGTVVKGVYAYGDLAYDEDASNIWEVAKIRTSEGLVTCSEDFLYLTKGEAKHAPARWYEILKFD